MVDGPLPPCDTVTVVGFAEIVKSGGPWIDTVTGTLWVSVPYVPLTIRFNVVMVEPATTVSVAVPGTVAVRFRVQVATPAVHPLTLRFTVLENPLSAARVIVDVLLPFSVTGNDAGLAVIVKS